MAKKYPLKQVTAIKKKRYDAAVALLKEKKALLKAEEEKLVQAEKKRAEARQMEQTKLQTLREKMDEGEGPEKISQRKREWEMAKQNIATEEENVKNQQTNVENAKKEVEKAHQELIKCQKGVEKMKIHKEEWKKDQHKLEVKEVAKVQDEIGTASSVRKRNKR